MTQLNTNTIFDDGFRLGRLFGIPITASWSWVPIALLIVFSLASAVGFGFAILGTVLLFGSILLHELGHALTARRYGIRTQAITLHLFGGVAKIMGEPRTPRQEFLIAAAGPAVSLALAFSFRLLAEVTMLAGVPTAAGVLYWSGTINFILGLFNLLPGLPLDGGRILRAWLWSRRHGWPAATRIAARSGQTLGYGMIGIGVLGLFGLVPVSPMIALLGWFVSSAAAQERRRAEVMAGGGPRLDELFRTFFTGHDRTAPRETARTPDHEPRDEAQEYVVRYPDGREVICRERSGGRRSTTNSGRGW